MWEVPYLVVLICFILPAACTFAGTYNPTKEWLDFKTDEFIHLYTSNGTLLWPEIYTRQKPLYLIVRTNKKQFYVHEFTTESVPDVKQWLQEKVFPLYGTSLDCYLAKFTSLTSFVTKLLEEHPPLVSS